MNPANKPFLPNPYIDPLISFVPERVIALIDPPKKLPILTSNGAIYTWISCIASNDIGDVRVDEPGIPDVPDCPPNAGLNPIASLLIVPSIVTLLYLKLVPANELLIDCGTNLVKSVIERANVGMDLIRSSPKFDCAPVLVPPLVAVMTTSVNRVFSSSSNTFKSLLPKVKYISDFWYGLKPTDVTLIMYGPPTLIL